MQMRHVPEFDCMHVTFCVCACAYVCVCVCVCVSQAKQHPTADILTFKSTDASAELQALVRSCWDEEPTKRPSASQLCSALQDMR